MTETKKGKKKEEHTIIRADNFQKFYVTNFNAIETKYDFRIELMNEKLKFERHWDYISDAMVILTPQAAKKLRDALTNYIKKHEEKEGTIEKPDMISRDVSD